MANFKRRCAVAFDLELFDTVLAAHGGKPAARAHVEYAAADAGPAYMRTALKHSQRRCAPTSCATRCPAGRNCVTNTSPRIACTRSCGVRPTATRTPTLVRAANCKLRGEACVLLG